MRSVAESRLPVIAGVGHETDFTLVDFAADLRAPTPSAAAEVATPALDDLLEVIAEGRLRLDMALRAALDERRFALQARAGSLRLLSPQGMVESARQQVDGLAERLAGRVKNRLDVLRERLNGLNQALEAVSPLSTMERGYAVVTSEDGSPITDARQAPPGARVSVRLHRGALVAIIETSESDG